MTRNVQGKRRVKRQVQNAHAEMISDRRVGKPINDRQGQKKERVWDTIHSMRAREVTSGRERKGEERSRCLRGDRNVISFVQYVL